MTADPVVISEDPLDAGRIRAALPKSVRLGGLAVHPAVDSTNDWLHRRARTLPIPYACLSEHQLAGRGRRGRTWQDGAGRDICLSMLWKFASSEARVQGLSLAAGAAAWRALRAIGGARGIGLKWPNDIVWQDRKLGGVLVEGSFGGGAWTVVIGVGINVRGPAARGPETRWSACLDEICGVPSSRNRLATALIAEIWAECARFESSGARPAIDEWKALDAMSGRRVRVDSPQGKCLGIARGVDEGGELLVEVDGVIERFVSAEVSLRRGWSEPTETGT